MSVESDVCRIDEGVFVGCPEGSYEALCSAALAITAQEVERTLFRGANVGIVSERLAPTVEEYLARRELSHLARAGVVDHLFLRLPLRNAGENQACFLLVPCPELASFKARERSAWNELAAELGSALRLHQAIAAEPAGQEPSAPPNAIMKLCGNGGAQRANAEQAAALWRGLLDGRWSLVAETNAQGKRVLLVRRTNSQVWPRLSEREKRVARSVLMGQSNKSISFELGISPAATTAFVGSALKKLGLHSRAELSGAFRARALQKSA
jgi:DNA-binding CsgD family transcriptional regulator